MYNKKPDAMAKELFNNCIYFSSNKKYAKECALYFVAKILSLKLKIDDLCYWKIVEEEIYKLK